MRETRRKGQERTVVEEGDERRQGCMEQTEDWGNLKEEWRGGVNVAKEKNIAISFYASCLHGVTSPPLAHETMSADRHTKTVGEEKGIV